MNTISVNFAAKAETDKTDYSKMSKAEIWQEVLDVLADPSRGMSEQEKQEYMRKVQQKMKSGKRLSSEEMNFLRINNPQLYRSALRVETARKAFRQRLSHCKSKEEANQVISNQMEGLRAMKGDPDREYMIAMVKYEVEKFHKSSDYARLPEKREDADKNQRRIKPVQEDDGQEEDTFRTYNIFARTQIQCEMIVQMAKAF